MDLGLKEQFTALMHGLLEPVCPPRGIAYLLRRHPTGSYFPFAAVLRGQPLSLSTNSQDLRIPFYLMPFSPGNEFDERDSETLRKDTPLQILGARGRVEVAYLDPPVRQQICSARTGSNACPPDMILVVSAPTTDTMSEEHIYPKLAAVASRALSIWTEVAQDAFKLTTFSSLPEMAEAFFSQICDESPEPIYYPLLNVDFELLSQGVTVKHSGINPLTYNCFLLRQQATTLSYLLSMREKASVSGTYIDDLILDYPEGQFPSPVRAAAIKTIDVVCPLDKESLLFVRHNRPRDQEDHLQKPAYAREGNATVWNRLRTGLQYLSREELFEKDVLATVWGFDATSLGSFQPHFIGLRPGKKQHHLAVSEAEGEKFAYELGSFSVPMGVSPEAVKHRLNRISIQLRECSSRLDPVAAAYRAWEEHAMCASSLMPAGNLHDIYSERSSWGHALRERHCEVVSLVSSCLKNVLKPFLFRVDMPPCNCCLDWRRCWSLHALWCLRKNLLHPSMLTAFRSTESISHQDDCSMENCGKCQSLNRYIWPKVEEGDCLWPVDVLRCFTGLRMNGGLGDIEIAPVHEEEIKISCLFSVRNPERWVSVVLKPEAVNDGGYHPTNRAFSFFHKYAKEVEVGSIRRVGDQYQAQVHLTLQSYIMQ